MKGAATAMLLIWAAVMFLLYQEIQMSNEINRLRNEVAADRKHHERETAMWQARLENGFWYVPGGVCYPDEAVAKMLYEFTTGVEAVRGK